jgi:hypothetical protein
MTFTSRHVRSLFAATAMMVSMVSSASAQTASDRVATAVKKLEMGCAADVQRFCGSVTPGEGRLFFCVLAHENQVSQKCDLTLYEASRNLERTLDRVERLADACWADIERHCASTEEGAGRVAQCLAARTDLSPACQSSLGEVPTVRSVGEAAPGK